MPNFKFHKNSPLMEKTLLNKHTKFGE